MSVAIKVSLRTGVKTFHTVDAIIFRLSVCDRARVNGLIAISAHVAQLPVLSVPISSPLAHWCYFNLVNYVLPARCCLFLPLSCRLFLRVCAVQPVNYVAGESWTGVLVLELQLHGCHKL